MIFYDLIFKLLESGYKFFILIIVYEGSYTHMGHSDSSNACTYWRTPYVNVSPRLPPGFTMGPLRPEDTLTVRSWWKYNWSESYAALSAFINHLPSVGVFTEDEEGGASEGDRKLVSWIHQYKNGNMGNTFTLPEYRRLGLARCATLALARKIIESGLPANLVIDETNIDSILFHEKIGFKKQCGVGWNASLPLGVALEEVIRARNDWWLCARREAVAKPWQKERVSWICEELLV